MNKQELLSLKGLEQQLHRQELALARTKGKKKKKQLTNNRLKIRLGHLLCLCSWHHLQQDEIESRLVKVADRLKHLKTAELENLQSDGYKLLLAIEESAAVSRHSEPISGVDRIELRNTMIELGAKMIEHQLQHHNRSVLFAVLQKIDTE